MAPWLLYWRHSHIDNVLLGETKTRVHRHLEKTEDVVSYSSEQQEESTRILRPRTVSRSNGRRMPFSRRISM